MRFLCQANMDWKENSWSQEWEGFLTGHAFTRQDLPIVHMLPGSKHPYTWECWQGSPTFASAFTPKDIFLILLGTRQDGKSALQPYDQEMLRWIKPLTVLSLWHQTLPAFEKICHLLIWIRWCELFLLAPGSRPGHWPSGCSLCLLWQSGICKQHQTTTNQHIQWWGWEENYDIHTYT